MWMQLTLVGYWKGLELVGKVCQGQTGTLSWS